MSRLIQALESRILFSAGIALSFVLPPGVGVGLGWGIGAFGSPDFRGGAMAWGCAIPGLALSLYAAVALHPTRANALTDVSADGVATFRGGSWRVVGGTGAYAGLRAGGRPAAASESFASLVTGQVHIVHVGEAGED